MVTRWESRGRWKFGCRNGTRKRGHETESKTRVGWGKAAEEEEKGGGPTSLEHFNTGMSLLLWGAPSAGVFEQHPGKAPNSTGIAKVGAFFKGRRDPSICNLPLQDSRKPTLLCHLPLFQPFIPP